MRDRPVNRQRRGRRFKLAPVEVLFARASQAKDAAARESLVRRYLPLARSLALRYRRGSESFDDLFQVASLGLVKAINRFEPRRGTSFESYATPTILGELKRHFRDRVMPIHLPRGLKEGVLEVSEAAEELTGELDREPSLPELAGRAEMSEEEVAEAMQATTAMRTMSLDTPVPVTAGELAPLAERVGKPDRRLELADERAALWRACRVLDDRQRAVIRLRFVNDLTQEQIAKRIGISQVHVSRILRVALRKLRDAVGEETRLVEAA
jgi:RNA polymerase sigma-B factor